MWLLWLYFCLFWKEQPQPGNNLSVTKWSHLNLITSVRHLIANKGRLLGLGCKDSKNSFEDTVGHITVHIAASQLPVFPKCQIYSPNPNISQSFTLFNIHSKAQILLNVFQISYGWDTVSCPSLGKIPVRVWPYEPENKECVFNVNVLTMLIHT